MSLHIVQSVSRQLRKLKAKRAWKITEGNVMIEVLSSDKLGSEYIAQDARM